MTFHSLHPKGLKVFPLTPEPLNIQAAHVLDSSRPVPPSFKGLPASPFLVPAVLDALTCNSYYISTVEIVPAEADVYCATAARRNGGIILTSDSDMLVHDLGPNGAVAFLNQIQFRGGEGPSASIRVSMCKPREVAKRLGLESLLRLAFEIKKDPSSSFMEALRRARQYKHSVIRDVYYEEFLLEYASETLHSTHSEMAVAANAPVDPSKQLLDPRISEIVLQFAAQSRPQIKMYLPFLIDDTSRSCAWVISASLRSFAYSLLLFLKPEPPKVRAVAEYVRRGLRITSHEGRLLSKEQCLAYAESLMESFREFYKGFGATFIYHYFKAYGVYLVCKWYLDNDKPLPARQALSQLLRGAAGTTLAWLDIHLSAQLQAALYSLRMAKQILRYVKVGAVTGFPTLLRDLDEILIGLEPMDRLVPSRLEAVKDKSPELDNGELLDAIYGMLGEGRAEEPEVEPEIARASSTTEAAPSEFTEVARKSRKKGRRTESKEIPPVSKDPTENTNNMYRILAEA